MPKAKRITRAKDIEAGKVLFTVVESGKTLEAVLADLPPAIQTHLAIHGLNAKVGDAAADKEVDAFTAMTKVLEQLRNGEWGSGRTGGGGKISDLVEVLVKLEYGDVEAVTAKLESLDDEKKKSIRAHPAVKAELAELRAKRATEKAKSSKKAAKEVDSPLEF